MTSDPMAAAKPGRLGVGIIGAGRVGAVLGSALRAAGHAVVGASAVSQASLDRVDALLPGVPILAIEEVVERSELVLVTVPDDVLADVVGGLAKLGAWQPGQLVVHTAGRFGWRVLEPVTGVGAIPLAVHPAMTFTGTSIDLVRLQDACCGVTAPAAVLPIAQALVVEMGAEPVVIAEEKRGIHHAALAHGSNHLVTLINQAMDTLRYSGIEEPGRLLGPLAHAALDNVLRMGDDALTGPVSRGDSGTVAEHLSQLGEWAQISHNESASREFSPAVHAEEILLGYRNMARLTTLRALNVGRVDLNQAQDLLAELGDSPHEPEK